MINFLKDLFSNPVDDLLEANFSLLAANRDLEQKVSRMGADARADEKAMFETKWLTDEENNLLKAHIAAQCNRIDELSKLEGEPAYIRNLEAAVDSYEREIAVLKAQLRDTTSELDVYVEMQNNLNQNLAAFPDLLDVLEELQSTSTPDRVVLEKLNQFVEHSEYYSRLLADNRILELRNTNQLAMLEEYQTYYDGLATEVADLKSNRDAWYSAYNSLRAATDKELTGLRQVADYWYRRYYAEKYALNIHSLTT